MFEERFIAFVDILGFKEIVKKASNDVEYQEKVSKVLNYIAKIRNDNYYSDWARHGVFNDVSVFSDSIVISYPCDRSDGDGLFYLLMDLIHLCFILIRNDIYVRGGITVGKVIHNQNISWGSAFVQAYELENQNAIYPRIIIDKKAIERGKELYYQKFPLDENGDDLGKLISRDADGAYFLDYLSQWGEFDYPEDYFEWLEHIRVSVENNLKNESEPRIKMKYVWFARYYNDTVKKLNECSQSKFIDFDN